MAGAAEVDVDRPLTGTSAAQLSIDRFDGATPRVAVSPPVAPLTHVTAAHLRDSLYRRLLATADIAAISITIILVAGAFGEGIGLSALLVPPIFVATVKAMGLYERDEHLLHKSTLDEIPALVGLAAIATLALFVTSDIWSAGALEQVQVAAAFAVLLVALVGFRPLARTIARTRTPPERCLLIGDTKTAAYVREKLALSPAVNAELVGSVPPPGSRGCREREQLPRELRPLMADDRIDRVILAFGSDGRDDLLYLIRELKSYGVKVSVLPEASSVAGSSVELDHLHGMTLLGMRRFEITRSSRLVKRSFDLLGSTLVLLFASPVLIAAALAVRIDSPGPILFRQRRVGLRGGEFVMLKFRSMVTEAEQLRDELAHLNEAADGLFKIVDDPRVTRVGRFLRKTQLDELPQLLNVFRGEMSLVGPRPLIPEEDRQIEGWYRRRLEIRPGMTGHWQILGSSQRLPLAEMVKLDYLYLANWSLWSDIRLLLRTVPFVVGRRGL